MTPVGGLLVQPTQQRAITLFRDRHGYRYLGIWTAEARTIHPSRRWKIPRTCALASVFHESFIEIGLTKNIGGGG